MKKVWALGNWALRRCMPHRFTAGGSCQAAQMLMCSIDPISPDPNP